MREPLKTSVFRGFLTPWRKSLYRTSLYYHELAIFSEEPLEAQPGFSEVPYIACGYATLPSTFHHARMGGSGKAASVMVSSHINRSGIGFQIVYAIRIDAGCAGRDKIMIYYRGTFSLPVPLFPPVFIGSQDLFFLDIN
jgi:hypothetical protein